MCVCVTHTHTEQCAQLFKFKMIRKPGSVVARMWKKDVINHLLYTHVDSKTNKVNGACTLSFTHLTNI